MNQRPVPLVVVGAGGLLAGELLRLLEFHPYLRPTAAVRRSRGPSLRATHPHLAFDLPTVELGDALDVLVPALAEGPAAMVLALPHGQAAATWVELEAELGDAADSLYVVDLSADFRLRDREQWSRWYGHEHPAPEQLPRWTYGLPEWHREELRTSRRIAAAGCFATALQLAVLPMARAGLLDLTRALVLHAVTGSSGSGNEPKPGTHHPHRHGNLWAYSLEGHRHEAELRQAVPSAGTIVFVPHSGPFARGIHLSAALPLTHDLEADDAREVFVECYADAPFVEVLGEGAPDLRRVVGSNRASIGLAARGGILSVFLTLDNIVKGGSGQALQCLNLALGYPETAGLPRTGLGVS